MTLAINGTTTGALLRVLGLGKTALRTLANRRFVMKTMGAKCRAVFELLRRRAEDTSDSRGTRGQQEVFSVPAVMRLCSVLRYQQDAPGDRGSAAGGDISRSLSPARGVSDVDLLVQGREMFIHGLMAEYRKLINNGFLPAGSAVAAWLLSSCELALDHATELGGKQPSVGFTVTSTFDQVER